PSLLLLPTTWCCTPHSSPTAQVYSEWASTENSMVEMLAHFLHTPCAEIIFNLVRPLFFTQVKRLSGGQKAPVQHRRASMSRHTIMNFSVRYVTAHLVYF